MMAEIIAFNRMPELGPSPCSDDIFLTYEGWCGVNHYNASESNNAWYSAYRYYCRLVKREPVWEVPF